MNNHKNPNSNVGVMLAASARVAGFLGLIVTLIPVHLIYIAFRPNDPFRFPHLFHRALIRMLGFHIRAHGIPATTAPVLFVSNHSSYLDIPVLGALIPAAFVAKAEVARWPLFGLLAKLQRTVFIERRATRTHDHKIGM